MKKNILVIDDNPLNCNDFVAPLKDKYEVVIDMSLKDAERKVQMYHYDLIVIDIMMPTRGLKNKDELKTGLYFYYEKLKAIESKKQLRYLFWSNLTQETYDEFFRDLRPENVNFLHKEPKNIMHLYEKVNVLVGE